MAATETLTLHLPKEVAALVQDAVENGEYATPDAMVEDALRGWTELRARQNDELALRRICQGAIDDDRPGVEPGPVFARLEKRFQALVDHAGVQPK